MLFVPRVSRGLTKALLQAAMPGSRPAEALLSGPLPFPVVRWGGRLEICTWAFHGAPLEETPVTSPPTWPHLLRGAGELRCPRSRRKGELEVGEALETSAPLSSCSIQGAGDAQAGEPKFITVVIGLVSWL